jgi:glycerophosphoryl diester phosphodiesterase
LEKSLFAPQRRAVEQAKTKVESRLILRHYRSMATLSLTDEQVVELIKQLQPQSKRRVLTDLTAERDTWWQSAADGGENDMRRIAEGRGLKWDMMSEVERETFVDDLLHES